MADWKETLAPFRVIETPLAERPGVRRPKSIKLMCNRLKQIWRSVPNMSLAAMISECFSEEELAEVFPHLRDELLMKRLEDRYGKG